MTAAPDMRATGWRGVALALLLAAPLAHADPLWEGRIGTLPVVVELDPAAPEPSGRYFFRRHLHDIPLEGRRADDGGLRLEERADWRADTHPGWTLRPGPHGGLDGQWTGLDGRRLPIHLRRLPDTALPAASDAALATIRASDPYRFLQLSALTLRPGRVQVQGRYRLQWSTEPRTDVTLFQVEAGYPAATAARINRTLREAHWKQVASALECVSGPGGEYESTTTLRRIDAQVLSVSVFTSYYCGGAHPDFGDAPLNLDPRTGRELVLEDILWLGRGAPPAPDSRAWFDYRDRILAPWLAARIAALYPAHMQPDGGDGCDYRDPDIWKFPSWYATAEGLVLGPSFARVARACEYPGWSVLPWREIARHPGTVDLRPR